MKADDDWTHSIRFLAKIEEKKKEAPTPKPAPKTGPQDVRQQLTGNRNRPSWYNKR